MAASQSLKNSLKKTSNVNKTSKMFSWTEEETSLLLQVVIDYKASKTVAIRPTVSIMSRINLIRVQGRPRP